MRKALPLLAAAIALATGLVGAGWATGQLMAESVYTDRGKPSYHLLVRAPEIRDLPLVAPVGAPRYHAGAGDGPKPPDQTVSYLSAAPSEQAFEAAAEHARSLGWAPREPAEPARPGGRCGEWTSGHRLLRIDASPEATGTRIEVGLWG